MGKVTTDKATVGKLTMGKLRLDLERLEVESFEPTPGGEGPRGTVRGREYPPTYYAADDTCTSCQDSTRVGDCFCTDCQSCCCSPVQG